MLPSMKSFTEKIHEWKSGILDNGANVILLFIW